MGAATIKHPVPDRVKLSFVIFDIWTLLTFKAERQSARMSKIANDGLTRSGKGCFIAVMETVGVKELNTITIPYPARRWI